MSPRSFLEVAGGILHGLSYQQARNNTSKVGQVSRVSKPCRVDMDRPPVHMKGCAFFSRQADVPC